MWMMGLEALLDVNLALLNSDTDSPDLSLKSTQNIHHLSKASIIRWRRWSSLRGGSSGILITLYGRRLRCFALALKPKLGIRLHESLTPKKILNSHLGLSLSNIRHRTETDLCDKACKGRPVECSSLISSMVYRMCLHRQKGILMTKA